MSWFSRYRSGRRPANRPLPLALERLEARALLSTFFVVRADHADGKTRFAALGSALAVTSDGDTVQIEPNSSPGTGTVLLTLTIQGDPAFGPATLPLIPALTVQDLGGNGVEITNLALGSVTLALGTNGTLITHCRVGNITQDTGNGFNGFNSISGNTITGQVFLGNDNAEPSAQNDQVLNNTFVDSITGGAILNASDESNLLIRGNTFIDSSASLGTTAVDAAFGAGPESILNNLIQLAGLGGSGIGVDASGTVVVAGNRVSVQSMGTGILVSHAGSQPLSVQIAGNDLVDNLSGISLIGNASFPDAFGTIDLGGGSLGSPGGNDFHGFTGGGHFAIRTLTLGGVPTSATITARDNIFSASKPATAVQANQGVIDVSQPLSANQAFVDRLYANFLERPGSLSDLNGWVAMLPSLGIAGLASAISHSGEAAARLVDQLYLQYLGRSADSGGETFWVKFLQAGHTEEDVFAGLLSSREFYNRAPNLANFATPDDPDADFVRALYETLLGRAGTSSEVSSWVVLLPTLGRSGLISAIVSSLEFRTDQVTGFYTAFLHRTGSAKEVAGFASGMQDLLTIETTFAQSSEFFMNG
jgi:Domain of unknown function (DUF4214)